jgi:hypothetical protein
VRRFWYHPALQAHAFLAINDNKSTSPTQEGEANSNRLLVNSLILSGVVVILRVRGSQWVCVGGVLPSILGSICTFGLHNKCSTRSICYYSFPPSLTLLWHRRFQLALLLTPTSSLPLQTISIRKGYPSFRVAGVPRLSIVFIYAPLGGVI